MADGNKCKIVVFGAFGAGKTTFIRTLDPESKHVESNCAGGTTTVALDFGRIDAQGCDVHIFGTPGQERFEFAREIIGKGMDGAILLVDATSPIDSFTKHLYDSLMAEKVPLVVFLNKSGNGGSNEELLKRQFGSLPVWTVSAIDKKQSFEAVCTFLKTLPVSPDGHMHHH
jgi:hypothetical protein